MPADTHPNPWSPASGWRAGCLAGNNAAMRERRALTLVAALASLALVAAGCGSDDEESAQDRFCAAGDELRTSVESLLNIDPVAEGTNGVEAAIESVEGSVNEVADAAPEAAEAESDALETAVDDLQSSLSTLGGEITTENVASVADAVSAVATSAQALYERLTDC